MWDISKKLLSGTFTACPQTKLYSKDENESLYPKFSFVEEKY